MTNANQETLTALLTAIKAEHDGEYFYSMAAHMTQDAQGRRVFETLAKEERSHQEFLRLQYESLKAKGVLDPEATLGRPVELSRHSPIYSDAITLRIAEAHHEMSALTVAMQLEEAASTHYRQLAARAEHPEVKAFLVVLADWEQGHFKALEAQYRKLEPAYWEAAGLPR